MRPIQAHLRQFIIQSLLRSNYEQAWGLQCAPTDQTGSKKRPSYGGLAIKLLFVLAVFVLARKAPVMSSRKQHGAASNSLPSSVRLQQQLQISRQSFCGNTSWADVEQLIPEGWQYFRNRWEHNKEDWALALTWAQQQVGVGGVCPDFVCLCCHAQLADTAEHMM